MTELRKRKPPIEGEDEGGAAEVFDRRLAAHDYSWQRSSVQQPLKWIAWCTAALACVGLLGHWGLRPNFQLLPTARHSDGSTSQGFRLVAIGDIHGDLDQAKRVLAMIGLINSTGKWIGGQTALVQTGDLVDRGPDSMEVTKFFEELKLEAKTVGGRVHTLLGNHELMNLQSKFQYVSRQELESLGARNHHLQLPTLFKEKLRQEHWFKAVKPSNSQEETGLMLWWGALQPDAWFGDVLRNMPVGVILGEGNCRTAFVHAGVTTKVVRAINKAGTLQGESILAKLNEKVKTSLLQCPGKNCVARRQEGLLLGVDGPVWYRGYDRMAESQLCPEIDDVLAQLNVRRIVVGHNLQVDKRVRRRCGGRVELIDVGMSGAYLKGLAAWECTKGQTSVHYS